MCLLTMRLFMGQVGWVCGRQCGQGAQPEKPLEEQGWWGTRVAVGALQAAGGAWEQGQGLATPPG